MPKTINKPAGIAVFPPHGDPTGDCLLVRLLTDHPEQSEIDWPEGFAGGIAHRLDNATSGAILVAQSLEELESIRERFHEHNFTKTYLLLAAKDVPWDINVCDKPIAHDPRKKNRMTVKRGNNTPHRGKWYPARTEFNRVRGTLWRATMKTGVMHQIRVHAAFLGIPIIGDKLYGGGAPAKDGFFRLHHEGLKGPGGIATDPVPNPDWVDIL